MKRRTIYKIAGIGCLHTFLYIYLIPFVILPAFGENGLMLAVVVAIAISMILLKTIFIEKSKRSDEYGKN